MEEILKRVADQLRANRAAFDIVFDNSLGGPTMTRPQMVRLEAIFTDNEKLIVDLDELSIVLRGMK